VSVSQDGFIVAHNVGHVFDGQVEALRHITLTIRRGEFVALVGTSGVGKSTLLRLLGGLLTPTSGTVTIEDEPPAARERPIGIVFQRDNLMPWRTAYDNVRLPLELLQTRRVAGLNGESVHQRVMGMLTLVGLQGFEQSYPAELSGGMAQRVTLARALSYHPDLLLLDEPFGALDALTRERMGQELLRIRRAMPVTVFMVTHSIAEAVMLADRVVVMSGPPGTITAQFPVTLPRPRSVAQQTLVAFQECVAAVRSAIAVE
jgi:NitT/TauT family transport system ATP-binding protein